MSFQPPYIANASTGTAFAALLNPTGAISAPGGCRSMLALLRSGEYVLQPITSKPTRTFSTTATLDATGAGTRTFTPASMLGDDGATKIAVGALFQIDTGANMETIVVATVGATSFTGVTALSHPGSTVTPIALVGATFAPAIVLPVASPLPAAGKALYGWWHLLTAGEKRSQGVEAQAVGGYPVVLDEAADRTYAVIGWCVTGGECELNGH